MGNCIPKDCCSSNLLEKSPEITNPPPEQETSTENVDQILKNNPPPEQVTKIQSTENAASDDQLLKNTMQTTSPKLPDDSQKKKPEEDEATLKIKRVKSFEEKISKNPWIEENFQTTMIEPLGKGANGRVFGTIYKKTNKKVAVKYMVAEDDDEFKARKKEIDILSKLSECGNVVGLIDKSITSSEFFIVMEKAECNLTEYIEQNKDSFKEKTLLHILADLTFGLQFAHNLQITHSDIKPANILVFLNQNRNQLKNLQNYYVLYGSLVFKLSDWGGGCLENTGKTTKIRADMGYTPSYAAPELMMDSEHVNFEKADIYSLGMTFLNCCGVEYNDMKKISQIEKEEKHDKKIKKIVETIKYEKFKELLIDMLKFDRHKRIDLAKVIETLINLKPRNSKLSIALKMPEPIKIEQKEEDKNEISVKPEQTPNETKNINEKDKEPKNEPKNEHIPDETIAKLISEMPNFNNDITKEAFKKCGLFQYDQNNLEDENLPILGLYEFPNGSVYKGQWKNGQKHGKGEFYQKDGSIYEGYFKADMFNGKGRKISANGDIYEGEWKDDKAHNKGVYLNKDGSKYEGDWYEDKPQGSGVETWPDGNQYEGLFVMGKKNGQGELRFPDGKIYKGEFLDNNFHGYGVYEWGDGRKYSGTWKNGKMEGKGEFVYSNGQKYVGEYIDERKEGYGEFFWPSGKIYKGNWLNGKQHGKGVLISPTGEKIEGEWNDGKKIN